MLWTEKIYKVRLTARKFRLLILGKVKERLLQEASSHLYKYEGFISYLQLFSSNLYRGGFSGVIPYYSTLCTVAIPQTTIFYTVYCGSTTNHNILHCVMWQYHKPQYSTLCNVALPQTTIFYTVYCGSTTNHNTLHCVLWHYYKPQYSTLCTVAVP